MAIAFATAGAAANGVASVAVPYPASIAAGDLLILSVVNKFNPNAPTTPSGWTLQGQVAGGSGADGADVGTIITSVYTKVADGTESGNLTLTCHASNNVALARMYRYTKGATNTWSIVATTGSDNTAGTAWSVTGAANPGITANDMVFVASGSNTDTYTYSLQAITATGATFGTMVERGDDVTGTGSDVALVNTEHPVTAGTASAAPVYTMTASGTTTNRPAGSSVILRLRETNTAPTVALNTTDATDFAADTTPTLEFTGTDADTNDIRYKVQIDTSSSLGVIDSYNESNSNFSLTVRSGGNIKEGQSFTGNGATVVSATFLISKTGAPTGNVTYSIYAHTGTFGAGGTGTGAALATSDVLDISTLTTTLTLTTLAFSGVNQISLTNGTKYVVVAEYSGGDGSNCLNVGIDTTSPAHAGNRCRYIASWSGDATGDYVFYVNSTLLLDKTSGTDSGFVNTVNGGDSDPFTSGQKVSYTVQAGDALAGGTYYWRARGIDPSGTNTYGAWPAARTFTVTTTAAFIARKPFVMRQAVNRAGNY